MLYVEKNWNFFYVCGKHTNKFSTIKCTITQLTNYTCAHLFCSNPPKLEFCILSIFAVFGIFDFFSNLHFCQISPFLQNFHFVHKFLLRIAMFMCIYVYLVMYMYIYMGIYIYIYIYVYMCIWIQFGAPLFIDICPLGGDNPLVGLQGC